MQTLWRTSQWMSVKDLRSSIDYHRPAAYTTIGTVANILCDKGLAHREVGASAGHPESGAYWYRAARPQTEHIGSLIATLLDCSTSPAQTLAHALATARGPIQINDLVPAPATVSEKELNHR